MPAAQRGWQALDASRHPSAMQNSLPGRHQLDAAVTYSSSLSFQRQQPRAQLGQEYGVKKEYVVGSSRSTSRSCCRPARFAVMKSQGHDKSRHVGSCAAQLSSRVLLKSWLLPLFRLPLSLSTPFSSPTCLAGRLSRPPCVVTSSPSVLFAILSESDVLLEAQLGAQLLTLPDLCRYHL